MGSPFNPYQAWLEIEGDSPPDYYQLLGIPKWEHNINVIDAGFTRRFELLHRYSSGALGDVALLVLSELQRAYSCLTHGPSKEAYDAELRSQLCDTSVATIEGQLDRSAESHSVADDQRSEDEPDSSDEPTEEAILSSLLRPLPPPFSGKRRIRSGRRVARRRQRDSVFRLVFELLMVWISLMTIVIVVALGMRWSGDISTFLGLKQAATEKAKQSPADDMASASSKDGPKKAISSATESTSSGKNEDSRKSSEIADSNSQTVPNSPTATTTTDATATAVPEPPNEPVQRGTFARGVIRKSADGSNRLMHVVISSFENGNEVNIEGVTTNADLIRDFATFVSAADSEGRGEEISFATRASTVTPELLTSGDTTVVEITGVQPTSGRKVSWDAAQAQLAVDLRTMEKKVEFTGLLQSVDSERRLARVAVLNRLIWVSIPVGQSLPATPVAMQRCSVSAIVTSETLDVGLAGGRSSSLQILRGEQFAIQGMNDVAQAATSPANQAPASPSPTNLPPTNPPVVVPPNAPKTEKKAEAPVDVLKPNSKLRPHTANIKLNGFANATLVNWSPDGNSLVVGGQAAPNAKLVNLQSRPPSVSPIQGVGPITNAVFLNEEGALLCMERDGARMIGPSLPFVPPQIAQFLRGPVNRLSGLVRVSGDRRLVASLFDDRLEIWSFGFEGINQVIDTPDNVLLHDFAISPAGDRGAFFVKSRNQAVSPVQIRVWSLDPTGPDLPEISMPGKYTKFQFLDWVVGPEGDERLFVWAQGDESEVLAWSIRPNNGDPVGPVRIPTGRPESTRFAWSRDGTHFAVAGKGNGVHIHELTLRARRQRIDENSAVGTLAYSNDGRWLAIGTDTGRGTVWNTETGKQIAAFEKSAKYLAMAWSRNRRLATISSDGQLKIFSPDAKE